MTLPILLFPPFLLAGHYTGPDIQSRRISFRNTIKGRKRESHPTSSVCIDDPAITTTTTTIYACIRREEPPLVERGGGRGELDQTEFSRPLKFSACTTCWRRPRATDDTGRLGEDCNLIFGERRDAISLSRLFTIRSIDCIRDEIKAVDSRRWIYTNASSVWESIGEKEGGGMESNL